MPATHLHAGAARADITPPVGIAHAGWGAQQHTRAEGIDQPLSCTALVLAPEGTAGDPADQVAILDVDLCVLTVAETDALRAAVSRLTGIPAPRVRVSLTHTHAGPSVFATFLGEGTEMLDAYMAALPDRVAGAAWAAQRALRPARLAATTTRCGINVNRRVRAPEGRVVVGRNWDGYVDPTVGVLRLDGVDGRPLATVVHYAAHPTTLGPWNTLLSPDYPGSMRRVVEQLVGGTCLFLQGAAGNLATIDGPLDSTHDSCARLGARLGCAAAAAALALAAPPRRERLVGVIESGAALARYERAPGDGGPESDATVRVTSRTAVLPLLPQPPIAEAEAAATASAAALADLRRRAAPPESLREAAWRARRAEMQARKARLFGGQTEAAVECHAIRLGDVALVGWPLEPFVELAAAARERSPFRITLFSGYTNGVLGYLPTPEAYAEGGYEVETTPFAPDAAPRVLEATLAALAQLAK